ncbi:MAG: DUF6600 domain-containing protein [Verrucomicrobiota bacterium]
MNTKKTNLKLALACAAVSWLCWNPGNVCQAQSAAPGLAPDLQEVVKLSQAKMPDDVIRSYIVNSGKSYRLSADDILYLNSQGVSAGVIGALQATIPAAPAPAPVAVPQPPAQVPEAMPGAPAPVEGSAPPMAAPDPAAVATPATLPPPEVNFQYFQQQLAPFGTWVNVGGAMYWRPDAALAVNPDWRPYYDMGQWVETENGLYWQSDYTWGDIPFHYGRWVLYPGMGWLWAPDYVWGPAWVFWRHDEVDGCIGWAPLPVGAVFVDGGFRYRGVMVGLDFDFGLGEGCFTFVDYAHFHERFVRMRGHEWAGNIDHARMHGYFGHSVIRNDFHRDEHGRFVNNGIGHDRVERLTHVEHSNFEERNPVGDRNRAGAGANRGEAGAAHGESAVSRGRSDDQGAERSETRSPSGPAANHTTPAAPANRSVYRPPTGQNAQSQRPQQKDKQ